jgi:hypothetical protein
MQVTGNPTAERSSGGGFSRDHTRLAHALEPPLHSGGRQPDLLCDLLGNQPGVMLI